MTAKSTPPEGPSPEARDAFVRAIERGLHNRWPEYDFVLRRRETSDEPTSASPPDDGDTISGD